ncbi:unnamed protein product [Phytophthora fragariaefolia]|uniref:Unnamed protein product n=1 Tax=Phytophthora fragariaefolia TaxID=1490495 RepID=A0A9W7D1E3_9STRA|nr:unnamed protein product [Phytophthora fragariaefolia]
MFCPSATPHEYLRSELLGLSLERAKNVESAMEYMQRLFEEVFTARPVEPLPPDRGHYADLSGEELEKLTQLFLTDIEDDRANTRKWRARLHNLTRALYKSRKSLAETMEVCAQAAHAKPKQAGNPWLESASATTDPTSEDVWQNARFSVSVSPQQFFSK